MFNFQDALNEVKDIAMFHINSNKKKITLMFDPKFSKVPTKSSEAFVELVKIEKIKKRLDNIDQ